MAKIRLTDKDFKGIIKESVVRLLSESIDQNELLSKIVQGISQMDTINVEEGDNELEVKLSSDVDFSADIFYSVTDRRYIIDTNNGYDDIDGEFYVDVDNIEVYLDGEPVGTYYDKNNMVADALRDNMMVENFNLPSQKEFFDDAEYYD
jgi:hypothetical protein